MGHLTVVLALSDAGCAQSPTIDSPVFGANKVDQRQQAPSPKRANRKPHTTRRNVTTERKQSTVRARKGRANRSARVRRAQLKRSLKSFQDQSPVDLRNPRRKALPRRRRVLWDALLDDCGRWASLARDQRDAQLAAQLALWMEDQHALERRRYLLPPSLELRITEQIRFAESRAGANQPMLITSRHFAPKWPVKDIVVSSFFGTRIDPISGKKKRHRGVDFAVPVGSDVYAVAAGTVTQSERRGSYGHLVVIRHRSGWESRYAHLDKRLVRRGQRVEAGQRIAESGNSGRSTGPHLHLELRKSGKAVDPLRVAGWH